MDNVVSTTWLAAHLGAADLVVFDCSTYLPNEPGNKHDGFRAGHIPGARMFDIDAIADTDTTLPHMVPTAGRFAKLVGALGVSNTTRVVFYDQHGLRASPRGWWMMRLFGHDLSAVLDGGLPAWKRDGQPVEAGDPAPAPAAEFIADFRAERLRGIGDIKRVVRQGGMVGGGAELILDARARGRFDGTAAEPRAGLPAGHMPGAANLPVSEIAGAGGLIKSREELRMLFTAAGVDDTRPVITTCGSGVTACVLALGLVEAGFPEPAVYDGSWTEWALRPETPKVTS